MKGATKMMMLDKVRKNYPEMNYPHMADHEEHHEHGREMPNRASRGTLTWNNTRGAENVYRGDYAPTSRSHYDMGEPEARRRRDSRGRFRSEYEDTDAHYPYPPPVYGSMSRIGFAAHDGHERHNLHMIRGGTDESNGIFRFDQAMATEWMDQLENEDGTKGPHWTQEQTTQVMKKKGFDLDPIEFWVIMNAVYSDYSKVAKKYNVNNVDYYADLAKAWLSDADSVDNKVAAYYCYIAK